MRARLRRTAVVVFLAGSLNQGTAIRAQLCDQPPLTEPVSYPVASAPGGLVLVDLDHDGDNDIVVTQEATNTVAVLLNNGDGTFQPPQTYPTGTAPVSVTAIDIDLDGNLDVAVANSGSGDATCLYSNGNGTLRSGFVLVAGTEPRAIASGDFNGDSLRDLVVANAGSNNAMIFYGVAGGSFSAPVIRTTAAMMRPIAVAVGDLNGDGRDDFAVAAEGSNSVVASQETSSGPVYLTYATGTVPHALAIGDFAYDEFADLDIVVTTAAGIRLLAGKPRAPVDIALSSGTQGVVTADFNGDRRLDLVVSRQSTNELLLLYNSGVSAFTSPPIAYSVTSGPFDLAMGDVDGDGQPDVVVASRASHSVAVSRSAKRPPVSKPYVMVILDTSGSMAQEITTGLNSCGYPDTKTDAVRCAFQRIFPAYSDRVEFGLATWAMRVSNCSNTCTCVYSAFPQETAPATGCGPRSGDATTRAGAFIRVPVRQDNYWGPAPSPANLSELLSWVDGSCAGSTELFAFGSGPINGGLRDMKRYFQSGWTAPDLSISFATPLTSAERSCRSVNILLVVDGDDNCDTDADAVLAARELFQSGVTVANTTFKVRTYPVGLLMPNGYMFMEDIAHAGGAPDDRLSATNEAHYAQNESQLHTALQAVLRDIIMTSNAAETCNALDDNCNGCVDEGWHHGPVATNSGPTCPGGDVTLSANTFPGASYTWTAPGGLCCVQGQYQHISAVTAATAGTYTFTASVNGCITVSASTNVVINNPPSATIASPTTMRQLSKAIASVPDAGTGASYTWSVTGGTIEAGAGTRSVRFQAGSGPSVMLNVTVQHGAACSATGQRTIQITTNNVIFTDDPLIQQTTPVRAIHLTELRNAVNSVRSRAGLADAMWTDADPAGIAIKAIHITELRQALTPALTALGTTPTYTDPDLAAGTKVRAAHIQELREYAR